ncbi:MAG: hypothetical protein IJT88_01060 [Kiritimatiellae bacterium]|nr:hypothetical protein [Kiritimatiellia bacterium]
MSAHRDGELTKCRLCGKPITWKVDPYGRPKPFDADWRGRSHFLTCTEWRERCRRRDEKKRRERDARQGKLF